MLMKPKVVPQALAEVKRDQAAPVPTRTVPAPTQASTTPATTPSVTFASSGQSAESPASDLNISSGESSLVLGSVYTARPIHLSGWNPCLKVTSTGMVSVNHDVEVNKDSGPASRTLAVKRTDVVVTRASVVTAFDGRTVVNVNGTVVASPSVDANTSVTGERIDTGHLWRCRDTGQQETTLYFWTKTSGCS